MRGRAWGRPGSGGLYYLTWTRIAWRCHVMRTVDGIAEGILLRHSGSRSCLFWASSSVWCAVIFTFGTFLEGSVLVSRLHTRR